jgi:hypothetical protein
MVRKSYFTSAKIFAFGGDDGKISFYNSNFEFVSKIDNDDKITSLAFNTLSTSFGYSMENGNVTIVDFKDSKNEKTIRIEKNFPTSVSFNTEGSSLAVGTYTGAVNVYNLAVDKPQLVSTYNNYSKITMLKYSIHDYNLLAYSTVDGGLTTYDVNTNKPIIKFTEHQDVTTAICYSTVNKMLLCSVGLDCKVGFYDIVDNKTIKPIITDTPLTAISFGSDGRTVAVGTNIGGILIYDLRKTESPTVKLMGHKSRINYLDFARKTKPSSQSSIKLPDATSAKASRSPSRSEKQQSFINNNDVMNESDYSYKGNLTGTSKLMMMDTNKRPEDKRFETFNIKQDKSEVSIARDKSYTNINEMKSEYKEPKGQKRTIEDNPEKNSYISSFQNNLNALVEKKEASMLKLNNNESFNMKGLDGKVPERVSMVETDINFTKTKRKNESSMDLDTRTENFIKSTIQTEMFKLKQYIHDEISSLHIDLIRQFEIQHVNICINFRTI